MTLHRSRGESLEGIGCENQHREKERSGAHQDCNHIRHQGPVLVLILQQCDDGINLQHENPEQHRTGLASPESRESVTRRKSTARVVGDVFEGKISRYERVRQYPGGKNDEEENANHSPFGAFYEVRPVEFCSDNGGNESVNT